MYVVWTLVYLPFAVLYYYRASYSVADAVLEYFNNFLFTGETPLAWHMWYMHTLIVSVFLLWLLSYTRIGIEIFSSIVFFVALSLDVVNAFDLHILEPIVSWAGDGQNFVLTGLPALCLGILVKKYNDNVVKNSPPPGRSHVFDLFVTLYMALCDRYTFLLYYLFGTFVHADSKIATNIRKHIYLARMQQVCLLPSSINCIFVEKSF